MNLSQRKPASASSVEINTDHYASAAFDGNPDTRWSSADSDPQWVMVDLGQRSHITRVDLSWEGAYAKDYEIQVSDTGTGDWSTLYTRTNGPGGTESLTVDGDGRFVRMFGTTRATGYGYSLWSFDIFGQPACILSQGKPASASSVEANTDHYASAAFDGNPNTRWSSAYYDPQWVMVDLGQRSHITQIDLSWEGAYAIAYEIQISDTGTGDWRTLFTRTNGPGGTESLTVDGEGRFVRMYGTTRATGYGYSLWKFDIFGQSVSSAPLAATVPTATAAAEPQVSDRAGEVP